MAEQTSPSTVEIPIVPDVWPGEFGVYKHSKLVVEPNVWTLVAIWFLCGAVDSIARIILGNPGEIIGFVAGSVGAVGYTIVFLDGIKGKKVSLSEAFDRIWPFLGNMILLNLLIGLVLILSLIAFVIPFFFVFPRIVFANYYLVDKKLGVMDAYKASWAGSKGHMRKVYGIFGVNILIGLLFLTIIGIPFSIYFFVMYSAAFAVLYAFAQKTAPTAPKPAA